MPNINFELINPNKEVSVTLPNGQAYPVVWQHTEECPAPYPAKKQLQQWYKEAPKREDNKIEPFSRKKGGTIKNCMPVFDAISSGYIIPLLDAISIEICEDQEVEYSNDARALFSGHTFSQYKAAPFEGRYVCKFDNPWKITTPPGYSCIFTQPFFQDNKDFEVLTGIVDTDTYANPVAFPFAINKEVTNLTIPQGHPFVQVIPFKRDEWDMQVSISQEEGTYSTEVSEQMERFGIDAYKHLYWKKKKYD